MTQISWRYKERSEEMNQLNENKTLSWEEIPAYVNLLSDLYILLEEQKVRIQKKIEEIEAALIEMKKEKVNLETQGE